MDRDAALARLARRRTRVAGLCTAFVVMLYFGFILLALYISAVCVLPTILIGRFNIPFYFGGTALLIVVGVALDTVAQMESHMLTRHYDGFLKRGTFKGRR